MHARIAVFEQRDPEGLSELRRTVEARSADWMRETQAIAFYAVADASSGKGYGLTLFEDERTLRAAEPVFEKMAKDVPERLRGKRISVSTQEVIAHEVHDGANAVRISRLKGSPATSDETFASAVDNVASELKTIDGWKGLIVSLDRMTGASTAFTLWESVSAMKSSDKVADKMRRHFADEAKQQIVSVDSCEIVFGHDRAPRLVAG